VAELKRSTMPSPAAGTSSAPRSPSRGRIAAFRHAFAGCRHVCRAQPNAWIHAAVTVAVFGLGVWLGLGRVEWAVLALTVGLVWVAEFVNTAVEAVVDLASPAVHPLARIGKDVAAGAVLMAAVAAVVVGLLLLGPPLWARLVSLLQAL
jgi:diacylglycerol kinase